MAGIPRVFGSVEAIKTVPDPVIFRVFAGRD
jgi:hypothetical protein